MRLIDADALRAKWRAAMLHMVRGKDGMHPIALEILIEDLEKFPTMNNYCPNCGAKMDKGDETHDTQEI